MAVKGNDLVPHEIESVLLKKFGETFTRGALMWYSLLPKDFINSFEMLADSFIKAHAGARKVQAREDDIFRIAHGEFEFLREFVTRFQKERMLLPDVPDEWAAEAFTKGLNSRSLDTFRKLKEIFLKFQETTRADVHNGRSRGFRLVDRFATDRRSCHGRNNRSLQDKEASGMWDPSYPKLSKHNFNFSVVEIVSAMGNIKEARFSKPMRSDPIQSDPNLCCEYHGMNGHRTGDFRHLREEVETLLKNGHLREFLSDQAKKNYGRNRDNASTAGEDPHARRST
ncbi:PREDICTED: uncharacterized protein LOC109215277 [Nicotiana attenuata]|uniref:uncharacterized protein LOC109215277 n=1 Tax=Nicotiana attenuata TaxID=49451 RepID=UPI0009050EDF|nr:PREDICTED: uncharacterized protein LOC109215277 [Nicotiana attenuata]